jgi:hypothetical protein
VGALVLLLALLTGCRSDSLVEDGQGSEDFAVQMVAGTRMTFNYWLLDRFGARINNSQRIRTWDVVAEGVHGFGFDDVVLVIDSIAGGRTDSLWFRFSPRGDIYAYGYLASMIDRREGRQIPRGWDRLAGFSLLPPATWPVGYVDSTYTIQATGETNGEVLFFEIMVDGTSTAIAARQVDISKNNLLASAWFSSGPSAAVRLREELLVTAEPVAGELSELLSMTTPPGVSPPDLLHKLLKAR